MMALYTAQFIYMHAKILIGIQNNLGNIVYMVLLGLTQQ